MTIEQLLERLEQINLLIEDLICEDDIIPIQEKIITICEEVQLQYKVEQRLNERD